MDGKTDERKNRRTDRQTSEQTEKHTIANTIDFRNWFVNASDNGKGPNERYFTNRISIWINSRDKDKSGEILAPEHPSYPCYNNTKQNRNKGKVTKYLLIYSVM
jgi:hypothetical protein